MVWYLINSDQGQVYILTYYYYWLQYFGTVNLFNCSPQIYQISIMMQEIS
jgi:hypothetical protein